MPWNVRRHVVDWPLVCPTPLTEPSRAAHSKQKHRLVSGALAALLIGVFVVLIGPTAASAHTGFESSTPGDGEAVADPVSEIVVAFTGPAIPVGDEFTALDSSGEIHQPSAVTTDDGQTFVLTFEPPLAGGQVGVRWSVQAPDAHPIDGSFAFTVSAPASTLAPAAPDDSPGEVAPLVEDAQASPPPAESPPSLEEFLATDTTRHGEVIGLTGRVAGLLAVVLVLGGMAFMATTLRGSRSEIRTGLSVLRTLGLVVALGALLEFFGLVRAGGASVSSLVEVPGLAMTLRLVGGLAIAGGIVAISGAGTRRPAYSLSAAVLEAPHETGVRGDRVRPDRWDPTSSRWALAGTAAILASFWFDGHTVSKGPRVLHALLNSVHIAAGSVWAGGVIAMASVTWWRYRRGRPTRATELIVRFSSVATVALIAVAGAGLLMAVFVLDSFGELTGTEWGKILLLKTVAVAIAAGGGAYNHFVLLPALEAAPDDEELAAELRSTVTAEAILLAFVVVVTAWLVAAAS